MSCFYLSEGSPSDARMIEGEVYMSCSLMNVYGKEFTFLGIKGREATRVPCSHEGEDHRECPVYMDAADDCVRLTKEGV